MNDLEQILALLTEIRDLLKRREALFRLFALDFEFVNHFYEAQKNERH